MTHPANPGRTAPPRTIGWGVLAMAAMLAPAAASADGGLYRRIVGVGQHVRVLDATGAPPSASPADDPAGAGRFADDRRAAVDDGAPRTEERQGGGAIAFRSRGSGESADGAGQGRAQPLVTVASSLAIVLGLFAAVAFLYRRTATASGAMLPAEAYAVLGKAPLGPRQQLTLVRVGQRVLVLAIGAGTITKLSEMDDPDEVAHLTAVCQSGGARQTFHRTLHELGEESSAASGFVQPTTPPPRRGLFASG